MIEIALCLAIVGFALVAIIGVLPAGLNVQRENREETIINQDSTVWLDAIRTGARGYDELTNYVDRIVIYSTNYNAAGVMQGGQAPLVAQHKLVNGAIVPLNSGSNVVGLLTTPKYVSVAGGGYIQNTVHAYCRAISGVATEKPPGQQNVEARANAFAYRMAVEITGAGEVDPDLVSTNATGVALRQNLTDIRMVVRWPLRQPVDQDQPNQQVSVADSSRMTFRAQASGRLDITNAPLFFIRPHEYQ
ncbi:MAG: hypothetical protein RLY20_1746 [Verrucomicrobiota bacterium]